MNRKQQRREAAGKQAREALQAPYKERLLNETGLVYRFCCFENVTKLRGSQQQQHEKMAAAEVAQQMVMDMVAQHQAQPAFQRVQGAATACG